MPKPKTKDELIDASEANFKRLNNLIDSYPPQIQTSTFPTGTLNRNIRDVLAHLHHWHKMMCEWYHVGLRGEKPAMPSTNYSWKDTPKLNIDIKEKYDSISFNEARELLSESHEEVMVLIKGHTNEELFAKKRYRWTGSTSVGAYFIANTSSHYDWAYRLIKKSLKDLV